MDKLFNYLNKNIDKLVHFLGGYMLATILPINPLYGLFLALLAGKAKEDYDAVHPEHTADKYDMWATWAGGLTGFIALMVK